MRVRVGARAGEENAYLVRVARPQGDELLRVRAGKRRFVTRAKGSSAIQAHRREVLIGRTDLLQLGMMESGPSRRRAAYSRRLRSSRSFRADQAAAPGLLSMTKGCRESPAASAATSRAAISWPVPAARAHDLTDLLG